MIPSPTQAYNISVKIMGTKSGEAFHRKSDLEEWRKLMNKP
jgi:hypothetical protein